MILWCGRATVCPADGHLSWFQLGIMINKFTVNISTEGFLDLVFLLPQINIWSEIPEWPLEFLSSEVMVTDQLAWINWLHLMNRNHEVFSLIFSEGRDFAVLSQPPYPQCPQDLQLYGYMILDYETFIGNSLEALLHLGKHYFT